MLAAREELEARWRALAGDAAALFVDLDSARAAASPPVAGKPPEDLAEARAELERAGAPEPVRLLTLAEGRPLTAEWVASRRALVRAVRASLSRGAAPAGLRCSLSHSRSAVAAACASGARAIGIDLERTDRPVSERAGARFIRDGERALGLSPLELWTVKEACFKAFSGNAGTLLPDYEIIRCAGLEGDARIKKPHPARLSWLLDRDPSWTIALAVEREDSPS